ncbi:uncharacterized protein PV07_05307 [Cladophialophora immunda]|uniref:Uncharacterized protein n=1 Tax=Cladophialophora immunda TaxID=569365 RepID=A0A0D2D161_9EURO|nr:uncharacterized protein PV07_05307 [Cladophialophora immunda]KIW29494.1 hypothetical protein PV07_05307 [Cladophialophora immunda]
MRAALASKLAKRDRKKATWGHPWSVPGAQETALANAQRLRHPRPPKKGGGARLEFSMWSSLAVWLVRCYLGHRPNTSSLGEEPAGIVPTRNKAFLAARHEIGVGSIENVLRTGTDGGPSISSELGQIGDGENDLP